MGSNLCCMNNPSPLEQIHDGEEITVRSPPTKGQGEEEITILGDLTLKQCLISPSNFNHPQSFVSAKDDGGGQVTIIGTTTLKQCLLDSPNLNPHEMPIWRESPSPQVRCTLNSPYTPEWQNIGTLNHHALSSPEVRTEFFTPRLSFSSDTLGKLVKVDEKDDEDEEEVTYTSIMRRSQCGRLKKKVSFREEADIYIFYSCKENFEEKMIL